MTFDVPAQVRTALAIPESLRGSAGRFAGMLEAIGDEQVALTVFVGVVESFLLKA